MIRVAIVEDDPEILQTLALIIDGTPGFSCKHTYSNCEEAIASLPQHPQDVVLMDINLPGIDGIEGVRRLKERLPEVDFIMLTIQDDDDSVFNSLLAGATGYLVKDTPPSELLDSIKEVRTGGSPMSTHIARKIVSSFKAASSSPLTDRETEILQKLCDGDNYKVIADSLIVSGHTVRAHIKNIYQKLHVHSRAEAVKKALKDRLI